MDRKKVYIATNVPKEVEEYVARFCDYDKWDEDTLISKDELINKMADVDGLLCSAKVKVDRDIIMNAPKLKVICNASVGYNNFDITTMQERGIIGTHTPSVLDDTVADTIFGLILCTARRISELDKYVKDGNWTKSNDKIFFGLDVHHTTIGIVGMGRIGETIAKRAKLGFDMEVLYNNRTRKYKAEEELGVKYCEFKELLQKSDFIVVMTPLTDDTYHLIDFKEFDLMKKNSIFINASRGQIVNEKALIDALKNKKISGAGLDVFDKEPVEIENPLLKMPNVVTLPHIGSATAKTRLNMNMLAATSLIKALNGEAIQNIIPELRK